MDRGTIMSEREEGQGLSGKGGESKKYKVLVTKRSWGYKLQHREYSQ